MNIAELIRSIAQDGIRPSFTLCTVTAVNHTERTVDVRSIEDDSEMLSVNLQANQQSQHGVVLFPRIGSYVIVGTISQYEASFITLCDDVESVEIDTDTVTINGGAHGGLVNVRDLTSALNSLVQTFNSHTHPCPNGTTSEPTQQAATFKASNYEDTSIKH